jgi:hypothetical protein
VVDKSWSKYMKKPLHLHFSPSTDYEAAYMDTHLEIQGSMTTVTDITHKYINYPVTVKLNVAETPK